MTIFINKGGTNRLTRKCRDRLFPKLLRPVIALHHTHFPLSRKHPPDFMRGFYPCSAPPRAAKDEELRHVPNISVAGEFRPSLQQA